jgi:hypothetical protein
MASITCGNCRNTHGSADAVRNCYRNKAWMRGEKTNVASAGIGSRVPTTKWAKAHQTSAAAPVAVMPLEEARRVMAPPAKVPAGRYAIVEDGEIRFFKVDHGKSGGKWEGYVFVSIQASDETFAIRNRDRRSAILSMIQADVAGAMALYGQELGKCGHCGRTLTSDWRKKGIGPICAQKMGFAG